MAIWDIQGTSTPPNSAQWPSGAGGGDLFYNGGQYGQNQDWYNSPIGENIREDSPNLAYGSWASRMGIANNNQNFNQWFYKQFPRFQQAYGQATMDNPLLTIDQFMQTLPNRQQLMTEFNAQGPVARNADYSRFAPDARWLPR